MAASAAVEFRDVAKSYGDLAVLREINLSLPLATTTAIVGASGSGKTTLLRLINALERPDAGELFVRGRALPVDDVEAFRRGMGYAVQGAGLFPHLSAYANIVLVARALGQDEATLRERALALAVRMQLDEALLERYPGELSGGQQQRVGLCRALMLAPDLLLLDEPFSAVDPITRVELYRHFEALVDGRALSVVLVTHDMREAVRLAGHLVILNAGRVAQSGATHDVLSAPADAYVARLLEEQLQ
ncbi:MAG: ATP-binding cassette domain-containing protein [Pseudomonadota bacterium]